MTFSENGPDQVDIPASSIHHTARGPGLLSRTVGRIPGLFSSRFNHESGKVAYLTFDDGPSSASLVISKMLSERRMTATFFLLARKVIEHPARVHELREAGHSIGFHGFDHLDAWMVSPSRILGDLSKGLSVLRNESGEEITWFRPAFGRITPWTKAWAKREELRVAMWDLNPRDYRKNRKPRAVVGQVIQDIFPGAVVLLHDEGRAWKAIENELPPLLDGLLEMGYKVKGLPN